jgi:hypothetical protein
MLVPPAIFAWKHRAQYLLLVPSSNVQLLPEEAFQCLCSYLDLLVTGAVLMIRIGWGLAAPAC